MPKRFKGKPIKHQQKHASQAPLVRPSVPFFQDPVYHYVSGLFREAQKAGNQQGVQEFSSFMQQLSEQRMLNETYFELDAKRRVFERMRKVEKKKQVHQRPVQSVIEKSMVNVQELKRRIFNPQTSPKNMVKALEALPADERKKVIHDLTSFLRSKIQPYLKQQGY